MPSPRWRVCDGLARQGTWDDLVCLHRGGEGQRYEVWARGLRERLPRIRVPLSEGDRDLVYP
nr:DUF4058 family protein [Candidatus Entotheonella palauensis]